MKTASVILEGVSPYSQSKFLDPDSLPKIGKEGGDDYERRVWKHRVHLDERKIPYMPPMSLKKSLEGAAPYLGKIPGQGHATYTKRVKSGLLVTEPIVLSVNGKPCSFDDWEGEWLFLDAKGKAGDTRVKRCMPRLTTWRATANIIIVDEIITKDVLERLLTDAGMFVGVGRFRPQNGGFYGRFKVASLTLI